ncbi:MAG: hypothetical protein ACKVWV_09450 [Planctomycetota bacterium]
MDTWVTPRVRRAEIELEVHPWVSASTGPFPGYYTVDPRAGFRKVNSVGR